MSIDTEGQLGANRAQRRLSSRQQKSSLSIVNMEYERIFNDLRGSADRIRRVSQEQGSDLTGIVYRGEPVINQWLAVRRELPDKLEELQRRNLSTQTLPPAVINPLDQEDYFQRQVCTGRFFSPGISLSDIESMPLEIGDQGPTLSEDDICRIDKIFRLGWFNREVSIDQQVIRQSILIFVTQDEARPDLKITIPNSLRPLHTRLKSYFDYYTNLLRDMNLDDRENLKLYNRIGTDRYLRYTFLGQFLGCYLPARLGLTPSSAIKLVTNHIEDGFPDKKVWTKHVLNLFIMGAKQAYRVKGGLPPELEKYQLFDETMDHRASSLILENFGEKGLEEELFIADYKRAQESSEKIVDTYFTRMQVDSRDARRGYLDIDMGEHPFISKVRLASQYRRTLMLILLFRDGKTHLTLEIDKNQEVFGFPAELMKNNSTVATKLTADVLGVVLDTARKLHPFLEPLSIQDANKTTASVHPDTQVQKQPDMPKLNKRRQQIKGLPEDHSQEELPDNVVPIELPKYVVFCEREELIAMIDKNMPEEDADKAMKQIKGFEFGRGNYKTLRQDRVEGEGLVEIKFKGKGGGYRILLKHIDGNFYSLHEAGKRREIFNIRRRGN